VPLDAALAILEKMAEIRASDFVFPGREAGKPIGPVAMMQQLQRLGRGDLTVHGFRSCFSDWYAETTNFPTELREMALAHSVGTRVEQAYRRGDMFEKRRALMRNWAAYCDRLPAAAERQDNVVPMGAR
jgi:integrase